MEKELGIILKEELEVLSKQAYESAKNRASIQRMLIQHFV